MLDEIYPLWVCVKCATGPRIVSGDAGPGQIETAIRMSFHMRRPAWTAMRLARSSTAVPC